MRLRELYKWTFATAKFDESSWRLTVNDEAVALEHKPLEVLALLLRSAGEVVTREELIEAVWGARPVVDAVLSVAITKLRRALGDNEQTLIATVPRVGYQLTCKVSRRAVARGAVASSLKPGDSVPRQPAWRLLRPLDPAERGEVWLAEHIKTGEQRVYKFSFDGSRLYALKREVTIARLLRESLGERSEFADVLAWDFTEAPYFIESRYGGPHMEAWAEAQGGLNAVPLKDRIELMIHIADAVATAHDVGVLHKDLKPTNLLINGQPGQWQPCLVDFGAGRVLEPERLEALGITRMDATLNPADDVDSLSGTLLYLAPELLTGQVPTVRSDIYALGIVLYQLCVGDLRRPMSSGWEGEIDDPLLCEDIAAAANGNPDLRLASARELANRLRQREQRALQQQQARAAAEQAARNERALAAARARRPWMLVGMAVLGIGCLVTWQMYRMVSEANTRAVREMQVAQAVNQFLNRDLLATANPMHGGRANITLLDAINRAAPAIETRFANDPQVAAAIHQTLGEALMRMGRGGEAHGHFARAADLLAGVEGAAIPIAIARLREWRYARVVEGRQKLEAFWPELMQLAKDSPLLHAEAYYTRGLVARRHFEIEEAIEAYQEALRVLEGMEEPDLGLLHAVRTDLNEMRINRPAASAYVEEQQRALEALAAENGELTLKALQARQQLLAIQVKSGRLHELEAEYQQLIRDYAEVMGEDYEAIPRISLMLAGVYTAQERWSDAEQLVRPIYERFLREKGAGHDDTLNAANILNRAEIGLGRLEAAETLLLTGIEHLQDRSDVKGQVFLAAYRMDLVKLRAVQGRLAEAWALFDATRQNLPPLLAQDPGYMRRLERREQYLRALEKGEKVEEEPLD